MRWWLSSFHYIARPSTMLNLVRYT
uniref:Uncharacterized protein n=1 Tax=Rhizophora mucronata TaxID=61149 RepID=A0A2P2PCE3_RHIMU